MTLPPAERARLDVFARHMRTLLLALFLVALYGNLIPRVEGEVQFGTVGRDRANQTAEIYPNP